MASHPYGPRYGQTDKYGKPKCKFPSVSNGGIKPKKKLTNSGSGK